MKRYGETYLTRSRWYSTNLYKVNKSPFQYASDRDSKDTYSLSLLGVLNLEFLPWRIYCRVDNQTSEILGWGIKRRGY